MKEETKRTVKKVLMIGGVAIVGFIIGSKYDRAAINIGLNEVLKDSPELEETMMKAIEKTKIRRGES